MEAEQHSPEPVDICLGLRKHDVDRCCFPRQRLCDVLGTNDEGLREVGHARGQGAELLPRALECAPREVGPCKRVASLALELTPLSKWGRHQVAARWFCMAVGDGRNDGTGHWEAVGIGASP